MAKYVRTKDGRIIERGIITLIGGNFINNRNKAEVIYYNNILKEADTIEELCDSYYIDDLCFEGFNFDGVFHEFDEFQTELILLLNEDKANVVGYGFIKTGKGLIYVAKMNNDGILELI